MSIAEKLVALRGKESRAAFAAKLGISANTLRNYEAGLSLPNSDVLAKICLVSDVDPGWLLFDGDNAIKVTNATDQLVHSVIDRNDTQHSYCVDHGNDDDVIALPPTSTIEDNRELSTLIDSLRDKITEMYRIEFVKYKSGIDYIRIKEAFAIPSDAKYASFALWPEAMGPVLLEYLNARLQAIEAEGLDSWRKSIIMIPPDEELNKREERVFRRFKLKPTSKDVVSWFSNFFGKDTKLKRSRFCRWSFVVYAEDYIQKYSGDLAVDKINND